MRVALIVLTLVTGSTAALADDGASRYQFGSSDMLRVIDSQTGAVWQARSDGKGFYIMVPVPFQSPDGKSATLTPQRGAGPLDGRSSLAEATRNKNTRRLLKFNDRR